MTAVEKVRMAAGLSAAFIRRPVATTLLALSLLLAGVTAYPFLPVANLPAVDFPTMVITAVRPGADPATMAASVAAPLERALSALPGVSELTSSSSTGRTRIRIQFRLSRSMDSAAQDVQAAINAAMPELPADLSAFPRARKYNPAARPILILAMTSQNREPSEVYDVAETLVAQRMSQVAGVGDVVVSGAEQPAIRVRADPARIAAMGLSLDQVRTAIVNAGSPAPLGVIDGPGQRHMLSMDSPRLRPQDYTNTIVRTDQGRIIRLGDVASITQGVRNSYSQGWFNDRPAVIVSIMQEPGANVIETIDGVRATLPELNRIMPKGIDLVVMTDRAQTIRASVEDMEKTVLISIVLVVLVVFLFIRRIASTIAAAIAVPLSLAGTFAGMWLLGFSVDNLSLMAITIAIGFVVDDAIVMIENIHRNMENGMGRLEAALSGSREIGFTIVSISLSLIAAFIPLLFMPGILGRIFWEFSIVIALAILISLLVSLFVTPVVCAHFLKEGENRKRGILDRIVEPVLNAMASVYARSLQVALRHPWAMLGLFLATLGLTVQMYRITPKGFFPRVDSGLLFVWFEANADASFTSLEPLARRAVAAIREDPAVAAVATFAGSGLAVNSGRMNISLKSIEERGVQATVVANRLRRKLAQISGLQVWIFAASAIRVGARESRSTNQFTLWSADVPALLAAAGQAEAALKKTPQITDVSSDHEQGGLQANLVIDRTRAAQFGVKISDISSALANAFAQRQVASIYEGRNQYKVILEIPEERRREPGDLAGLYVPGSNGRQVPLSAISRVEQRVATISVDHQGVFPAVTISYELAEGIKLADATDAVENTVRALNLPDSIRADFAGDAKAFRENARNQLWLIVAAILAVYLILGILYESLIHPLTIISTLPSAGLGALLALNWYGLDLSMVAFIGIIMLIGIVKKNGIMIVDFAISAERRDGLPPLEAVHQACLKRFRPILMTTLSTICGALPLLLGAGPGSELRVPLGVTVVGGLALSQVLTLYTTPAIYLLLVRFQRSRDPSRLQRRMLAAARS